MNREGLGSDPCIAPANLVILLPVTAPAPMVEVKQEDVDVEEVDVGGIKLSSTGKELYEVLKQCMKAVCLVYGTLFRAEGIKDHGAIRQVYF